jgi:hypothetical protein
VTSHCLQLFQSPLSYITMHMVRRISDLPDTATVNGRTILALCNMIHQGSTHEFSATEAAETLFRFDNLRQLIYLWSSDFLDEVLDIYWLRALFIYTFGPSSKPISRHILDNSQEMRQRILDWHGKRNFAPLPHGLIPFFLVEDTPIWFLYHAQPRFREMYPTFYAANRIERLQMLVGYYCYTLKKTKPPIGDQYLLRSVGGVYPTNAAFYHHDPETPLAPSEGYIQLLRKHANKCLHLIFPLNLDNFPTAKLVVGSSTLLSELPDIDEMIRNRLTQLEGKFQYDSSIRFPRARLVQLENYSYTPRWQIPDNAVHEPHHPLCVKDDNSKSLNSIV